MPRRQRVLTVDDDPAVRRWIGALLGRLDVDVVETPSGAEALRAAPGGGFDLILLDVHMPGMDGYEVAAALARDRAEGDPGVPIIFLTGSDTGEHKLRAFEAGAVDYVVKPFEPAELIARVQAVLRTRTLVEQLERQATTDRLTGLLNRSALGNELEGCRRRLARDPAAGFGVLFMDLDRFKLVNDSLGHAVGDRLLCHVADGIRRVLAAQPGGPCGHVVARNGGDEFVVLLRGVGTAERCAALAGQVLAAVTGPVALGGHRVRVGASIGIRWAGEASEPAAVLLRDADTAMYEAKHAGRGRVVVFEESMHRDALARLRLEEQIRAGMDQGQFVLHYQPIVSAAENRLVKFEALVRWRHPTRGLLSPQHFIPQAEECGLIVPLGNHVIELACADLCGWVRRFGAAATPPVNINVSSEHLHDGNLVERLLACRDRHEVPLSLVGIEVTESTLIRDTARATQVLEGLHALGVSLSIDDFGTGYSSLSTLRSFPFDTIKIDRSFVRTMELDRSSGGIIHAIVELAWNLRMSVVAEGAETLAELAQLQALEVDLIQGYVVSRPIPAEAAAAMIARRGEPFVDVAAAGSATRSVA